MTNPLMKKMLSEMVETYLEESEDKKYIDDNAKYIEKEVENELGRYFKINKPLKQNSSKNMFTLFLATKDGREKYDVHVKYKKKGLRIMADKITIKQGSNTISDERVDGLELDDTSDIANIISQLM